MGPMPHPVWLTAPRIAPAHGLREFNAPHKKRISVNSEFLWVTFPTRTISDAELDQVFLANRTLIYLGIGLHNETWRLAFGSEVD